MGLMQNVPRITATAIGIFYRIGRLFLVVGVFYLVYRALLNQVFDGSKQILPAFGLWVFTAYVALPKVHRILTKYYLPNYYVGRVRSTTGLLSDPINLAFYGSSMDMHNSMRRSGWVQADRLTLRTFFKTAYCVIFNVSYPAAPVGHMYLFSRVQDFAYELEVGGSPAERHHIRFWKTPHEWRLPGGHEADWLAAATYDRQVGLKIATGQIDHLIHEHIDEERDFTVATLQKAGVIIEINVVKHFTDAYHDRNNGGDRIKTDGSLPFISV